MPQWRGVACGSVLHSSAMSPERRAKEYADSFHFEGFASVELGTTAHQAYLAGFRAATEAAAAKVEWIGNGATWGAVATAIRKLAPPA